MLSIKLVSALLVSVFFLVTYAPVTAHPSATTQWSRDFSHSLRIGFPGRSRVNRRSDGGPKKRATTCNGSSDLCDRLYSNVTFAGAHNSYAIATGSGGLASNQNVSLTAQLNAGIRLLQSQAHNSTNTTVTGAGIDLCHTS